MSSSSPSSQQPSIRDFFSRRSSSSVKKAAKDGEDGKEKEGENRSPNPQKRARDDEEGEQGVAKKLKTPEKEEGASGDASAPLSPEQKQRMKQSEMRCKVLQLCKQGGLSGALHPDVGPTWFQALRPVLEADKFRSLSQFVGEERAKSTPVYPPSDEVWMWTKYFDVKDTKVVILGQDPYHGPGQAHGLCFSVAKGVKSPPSLVNMFKELEEDIPGFQKPEHGDLTGWAKQGVLLLNACLTVRQSQPNSHKDRGWEEVTNAAIKAVSEQCSGVVFLLWGSFAQKKASFVNGKKHHLLKTVHPSPLSAHRGFFGCKHFSKCNELLKKSGKKEIAWGDL